MYYVVKHQHFFASSIAKYLFICFLLAALMIAGCDEDDNETSYSQDTNPYGANGDDTTAVHTPIPGAVILGSIGLAVAGLLLKKRKML